MFDFFKTINKKTNALIWHFIFSGVFLIILGVLIVGTKDFLEWLIFFFLLVLSWMFFYLAYKVWWFRKELKKHLDIFHKK